MKTTLKWAHLAISNTKRTFLGVMVESSVTVIVSALITQDESMIQYDISPVNNPK